LSFTADGNACATAVEDSAKVEIFDTTTGAALREIDFGNLNVNAVAWHPQLNAHSQRSILAIALESKDKTVPSLVPPASTSRREEFLVLASIQLRS
jgi:WD40 repeat protein